MGDTIPQIASEKAGIIKQDIPCVVSEYNPDTKPVFDAAAKHTTIHYATDLYSLLDIKYDHEYLEVDIANKATGEPAAYKLDLNGSYQAKNVLGVLTAVGVLQSKGWQISKQQIQDGLGHVKKNTGLYGRWQIINESPTTVVDVAHNVAGIQTLLEQIRKTIKQAAPEAEEVISYQMPAYKQHGILVYFAAFTNHIGFYATPNGHLKFKEELSMYKQGKGSVQFPIDQPIPLDLISEIVKFRVDENLKKVKK